LGFKASQGKKLDSISTDKPEEVIASVVPATGKAIESRIPASTGWTGQKSYIKKNNMAGLWWLTSVILYTWAVEHLLCKQEARSSNPNPTINK
jgi:hypothetical protein